MKKKISVLLIVSLLASGMPTMGKKEFIAEENRVLKSYVAITDDKKIDNVIKEIDSDYDIDKEPNCNIYQFETNEKSAKMIDDIKGVTVSEDVEVSACGRFDEISDSNGESEWNMQLINNTDSSENKDNAIDIAILDSGIDFSSDINVVDVIDLVDKKNEFNIFSDMTGHGTSIAGIIASTGETEMVKGINSNVNIYSARILDENNVAPISRVVEGIYWAIDKKVKIINISFGTTEDSDVLRKAISDAIESGILVVAAAGNTGGKTLYPAAYNDVLAVGSVDSKGEISDFSADDEKVDVMAPGECVKSVGAFGGSLVVSGTSISVPHVVGMASILWAKDKNVSADFIKNLIIKSSNVSNINKSKEGIIDVDYAIKKYDSLKKQYNRKIEMCCNKFDKVKNEKNLVINENDYVKGEWKKSGHKNAAEYAGKSYKLTNEQINIIKKGVVYPDEKLATMGDNPQWHTAHQGIYDNYISNYVCAGMIAKKIKKGKAVNTSNITKPRDMKQDNYNRMINQVASIKWTKKLLEGNKVTNENKALFAMGMALHVITDTYAHQAYMKNDKGVWYYLAHTSYDDTCDNHEYGKYKNRFQCAKWAAQSALGSYCLGFNPCGDDYFAFCEYKDFKLKSIKKYMINRNEVMVDDVEEANID